MKLIYTKLSQITVIEFSLLALLLTSIFFSFSIQPQETSNSYYSYNLDTYVSSISKLDSVRKNVILENLSNNLTTQDWNQTLDDINLTLNNFELIVSNNTVSKTIVSCDSINGKFFSSSFISSYNLTTFNSRTLTLGVCN